MPAPSIRTVQIWAQGFGETPAEINATVNGSVVFSGPIATVNEPLQGAGGEQFRGTGQLAFSFDIPFDFVGSIPVSIEVTGQGVVVTNTFINYTSQLLENQEIELGTAEFFLPTFADRKTNPKINNVLQIPPRTDSYPGEWYWILNSGDVLTFDLEIPSPGAYNPAND